jgi:ATP-dependent Clp protease ATP-binding subunit ClpC
MDFTKFNLTPSAKSAIEEARIVADEFGHLKVIDLHLMHVILAKDNANIGFSLHSLEINQVALADAFHQILQSYREPKRKKKIYAPEIFEILELAKKIANKKGHDYIGIDHIFLSCLESREEIIEFLDSLEIKLKKLIETLSQCISKGFESVTPQGNQTAAGSTQPKEANPTESCCENLNQKIAKRGTFEIFGRDKEIERAFEVLLRKNKSNIIFVGEAGVGKTAIVEGMAEKIVQRECPDLLLHKEILTLDITSVISGTIFRGQMEEKMKNILDFVSKNPQYILFIDEIHTIIGSGSSEGSLDLANILKPALSRGEISCIGATTEEEYKRYFKKDAALDRRFENINIAEPSKEDVKTLLMRAKTSYEDYHQVEYSEDTIDLIISLCSKYTPEKKFPDKAFDILDESGAKTKKINVVRPQEAKDMEHMFSDQEFVDSEEFPKFKKKYEKILLNWGEKLEKQTFGVDKEIIYAIFAHKLNEPIENIKSGSGIRIKGRIGF